MRPAAASTLVKSDFTDQEGLARRASMSSEGFVVEERVRIVDALAVWSGWILRVRRVLSQCLCVICAGIASRCSVASGDYCSSHIEIWV